MGGVGAAEVNQGYPTGIVPWSRACCFAPASRRWNWRSRTGADHTTCMSPKSRPKVAPGYRRVTRRRSRICAPSGSSIGTPTCWKFHVLRQASPGLLIFDDVY